MSKEKPPLCSLCEERPCERKKKIKGTTVYAKRRVNRSPEYKHWNSEYRHLCCLCRRGSQTKTLRKARKATVLREYGGECVCCGEANSSFLTMDHIHGRGNDNRKEYPKQKAEIWRWLIMRGFPDDFQILCFNCNCGRQVNGGICPHRQGHQ